MIVSVLMLWNSLGWKELLFLNSWLPPRSSLANFDDLPFQPVLFINRHPFSKALLFISFFINWFIEGVELLNIHCFVLDGMAVIKAFMVRMRCDQIRKIRMWQALLGRFDWVVSGSWTRVSPRPVVERRCFMRTAFRVLRVSARLLPRSASWVVFRERLHLR